jgi:thioesterase domain-containing protein
VQVASRIRARTGAAFPLTWLFDTPCLGDLAARIDGAGTGTDSGAIALRATGSRRPLFLVHDVVGTVIPYLPLTEALGPDQPVFAFEAPGLHDGAPFDDLGALAAHYVAALRARHAGPWRLGGWSLGGVIAYEMALQLTAAGETVDEVVLLDAYAVGRDAATAAALDDAGILARALGLEPGALEGTDRERISQVIALARVAGRIQGPVDLPTARRWAAVQRGLLRGYASWTPRVHPGRVHLVAAGEGSAPATWAAWCPDLTVHILATDHQGIPAHPALASLIHAASATRTRPG